MSHQGADLAAYDRIRVARPELFANPPGAAYEIVLDPGHQRTVGAGIVYQDPYVIFLRDAVRYRDGTIGGYIRLIAASGRGGAAVLPVLDASIVLIRHFRHATRGWHWEIPRGFAGAEEAPEQTARREVSEEIGAEPRVLIPLGSVHADTGEGGEVTRVYLAQMAGLGEPEAYEGIDEIRCVGAGEFDRMILSGELTDSFTLAAVTLARTRGLLW